MSVWWLESHVYPIHESYYGRTAGDLSLDAYADVLQLHAVKVIDANQPAEIVEETSKSKVHFNYLHPEADKILYEATFADIAFHCAENGKVDIESRWDMSKLYHKGMEVYACIVWEERQEEIEAAVEQLARLRLSPEDRRQLEESTETTVCP